MKGAIVFQVELEVGKRCKFNVVMCKNKNLVFKCVIDLCPELGAFAKFMRS